MLGIRRYLATAVLCLSASLYAEHFIDFEKEMMSDFVLDTKQIEIPGFPDAFNPSIVPWEEDTWLMSFRTGDRHSHSVTGESGDDSPGSAFLMSFRFREPENPACAVDAESQLKGINCKNKIGLVFLNRHFEPKSWPQILQIKYPQASRIAERQQDPRLIYVKNRLYMVFSNMLDGAATPEIRRMFVVELFFDGEEFTAGEPFGLENFEGKDDQKWTKNWVPFDFEGRLLLAHTINPHRIFEFESSPSCSTVAQTQAQITWDYGVLRGGTPAILDDGRYLAFFHSSKEMKSAHSLGKKIQHYFMGAYTFSSRPPFELQAISKVPIIGKNFLEGPIHKTWKPLRVVFPSGIIVGKEKVWVAYGRQDHEVWIATMDKKRMLESLVPVH